MRRGSPYHQGFGNGDAHITVTLGNNRLSLQPRPFATLETIERNWAELVFAKNFGIVTRDALIIYWSIRFFSLHLVTIPVVFAGAY